MPENRLTAAQVVNDLRTRGVQIDSDVPLSQFTTLRVGGPAPYVATPTSREQLAHVITELDRNEVPTLLLAGGSNLLIGDDGFDGVVVRISTPGITVYGRRIVAEAGTDWDEVVVAAIEAGLGGLECLSGIPGSAGATPVQNVGAYGVEVASTLSRVQLLDRRTGEIGWVAATDLQLGYRTSRLKHRHDEVVLAVEFELCDDGRSAPIRYAELASRLGVDLDQRVSAADAREAVLALRRGKAMVLDSADPDTWSAGSFFTNPIVAADELTDILGQIAAKLGDLVVPQYPASGGVKLSAGWLIERAGFSRGYPGDGAVATLSTKHTLALTNRGGASARDIIALAREIRDGVLGAFGVELTMEPVTVGVTL